MYYEIKNWVFAQTAVRCNWKKKNMEDKNQNQTTPSKPSLLQGHATAYSLFLAVAINFVVCFLFPMLISKHEEIFSKPQMLKTLKKIKEADKPEIFKVLEMYNLQAKTDSLFKDSLEQLENLYIKTNYNSPNIKSLSEKIETIVKRKERTDKEYEVVTFMSFLENKNIYVWWLVTSCLMFIVLSNKSNDLKNNFRSIFNSKAFLYSLSRLRVFEIS